MNFDKAPANKAEEKIITWVNPDGTQGRGTEKDRQEAVETWDRD